MKRILALLLVCAMLALAGCEEKENKPESGTNKEIIYSLPSIDADDVEVEEAEYSRFGNDDSVTYSYDSPKFFESSETELTAKVKITKYCGDSDIKVFGGDVAALFKAKILTCYKGDFKAGDDIYIMQYFSGHGLLFPGFPLFGVSDVMLLNLAHFTEQNVKLKDNIFAVVGDMVGVVDIVKYNGNEYAINRASLYYFDGCDITPVDEAMKNNVLSTYYEQDPVRKDIVPIFEVYAYKDLEKVIIEHYYKDKTNKGEK